MRGYIVLMPVILGLLVACTSPTVNRTPEGIVVEANEFGFKPSTLKVSVGQPVKVIFRNAGSVEHDWSIFKLPISGKKESSGGHDMPNMTEEPAVHVAAKHGQSNQLEFTPTTAGTYEFWCTVPGHKEAGMIGKLVVGNP